MVRAETRTHPTRGGRRPRFGDVEGWVSKRKVKRRIPDAYCVRLHDKTGYIVWPGKTQSRGFELPAIGLGKTARAAWASVRITK